MFGLQISAAFLLVQLCFLAAVGVVVAVAADWGCSNVGNFYFVMVPKTSWS